jgi:hypothetical protein
MHHARCTARETVRLSGRCFVMTARRFPQARHLVGLRPLRALDDVELDLVTFLQTLVSIGLDGAVVHEDVRSAFTSEKAVALRVIEPLHSTPILRQVDSPLLVVGWFRFIRSFGFDAGKPVEGFPKRLPAAEQNLSHVPAFVLIANWKHRARRSLHVSC